MKIYAFHILLITNILVQSSSESDINVGYEVTLAIPTEYTKGFLGRAFLIQTQQTAPYFRAAISVEAVDEKYSCSLDIFLGDVKVWSSGHLSRFYTREKCVLELTQNGNLRLKGQTDLVGWRSGTSGQGVKRLILLRTGNLVLVDDFNLIKWQSFNFPTDIMLWGQRLSSQTRLTSFPVNSSLFYSMEIQNDKIALFLNSGTWKYSYWEYRPNDEQKNITFARLTSDGLDLFNGRHKFDDIKSNGPEPIRFLALDNNTGNLRLYRYSEENEKFEASYQALDFTCDLPLACKPYGICTTSGSCSCIRGSNCKNESLEGLCGKKLDAEMLELQGVVSVLRSVSLKGNVGNKEECARNWRIENWPQHRQLDGGGDEKSSGAMMASLRWAEVQPRIDVVERGGDGGSGSRQSADLSLPRSSSAAGSVGVSGAGGDVPMDDVEAHPPSGGSVGAGPKIEEAD
ncbi:g-type lectin s-receptor-like serine/threonine-protein kinase sd2-5 [Phtheirospermum japonicum]|uniref:G-type lectin s-receptor-like serine/threonine-protein kinase sd2-5 n=1 Tax=Phtheirospermum japonicum TaxID=374723 RepID=A0A830BMG7_9LAMI|nr:g-type lectin s-receptor-like serine/threonine-protein kinase sd2-5 [Phtheirospermum japonicum]